MRLLPNEVQIYRYLLTAEGSAPSIFEIAQAMERLEREAPPLGAHVFRLECVLGTDARKETAANEKARREIRENLGQKALKPGQGPARVVPLAAPTLNEYNAMDPWRKEALRKAIDKRIADLKPEWPAWWCGVVERIVGDGNLVKCKDCKGSGMVNRKRKAGTVAVPCPECGTVGKVRGAPKRVHEGGCRRAVVLTRESSVRPDELAIDVCGGKVPVDRLVQAGVLRGDTSEWLVRYVEWKYAPPGHGRVLLDVYDLGR